MRRERKARYLLAVILGVICTTLFTTEILAANVSLFYDPAYVRMDRANNVLQSLQRLNHNVSTFTGTDEASWLAATTNADALVVPNPVWTPVLVNDLSPAAKNVLMNYVSEGGRFISHGAHYGRGTDLLYIFGYRVSGFQTIYGSTYLNGNGAQNTSFFSGPSVLPRLPSTFPLIASSLPANAMQIYRTEPIYRNDYTLCDVMAAPYGKGSLVYLGWEWLVYSGIDMQGVDTWEQVLDRAIAFTHPPQPTANAGPDQAVGEGTLVTLDGSGSSDPENNPLSYHWKQIPSYSLWTPIILNGADTAHPTFIASSVSQNVTITFVLEVDDGTTYSAPDLVNITIQQTNSPPVADAGDDRPAKADSQVTLSGLHSYDPDGNTIVSYRWTQVAGPAVVLTPGNDVPEASFMAPAEIGAQLVFKLQVSDGMEASIPSPGIDSGQPDTVVFAVVANNAPVANAGVVQTVDEGSRVVLDGTCSYDPDKGDLLSFRWEQVAGTPVLLDDPTTLRPSFVAPHILGYGTTEENLRFRLTVKDDDSVNPLTSEPAYVNIHVRNMHWPPTCGLARASQEILWPPDHKLQPVEILGVTAQGVPSDRLIIRITGVTQDEPTNGTGEGDTGPDAYIQQGEKTDTVLLRAERQGTGNGRVYRVLFIASDGYESSCTGIIKVTVPPSRVGNASDDEQKFDATKD